MLQVIILYGDTRQKRSRGQDGGQGEGGVVSPYSLGRGRGEGVHVLGVRQQQGLAVDAAPGHDLARLAHHRALCAGSDR